jgi:transcriptional regulator NrdR family protein
MKCPHCEAWTEVRETRKRADGTKRRRYECANLHKFTTLERVEEMKRGCRPRQKDPET